VVHLLAPGEPHAAGGLMAPRLGRSFLTAAQVSLSPSVSALLRDAAAGEVPTAGSQIAFSQHR
jgi:hypothetical protein